MEWKCFEGRIKKMTLTTEISGMLGFETGLETGQTFMLSSDGKGSITHEYYDLIDPKKTVEKFMAKELVTAYLLDHIALYFSEQQEIIFASDSGSWTVILENEEGKSFEYYADTNTEPELDGKSLSKLFRKYLNKPYLMMFDEDSRYPIELKEDEIIFVTVVFDESESEYCYICEDPLVCVDDTVLVPAGRLNDKTEATVIAVNVEKAEDAPYPIDKCKKVIEIIR